jgi:hypothetical protein
VTTKASLAAAFKVALEKLGSGAGPTPGATNSHRL